MSLDENDRIPFYDDYENSDTLQVYDNSHMVDRQTSIIEIDGKKVKQIICCLVTSNLTFDRLCEQRLEHNKGIISIDDLESKYYEKSGKLIANNKNMIYPGYLITYRP